MESRATRKGGVRHGLPLIFTFFSLLFFFYLSYLFNSSPATRKVMENQSTGHHLMQIKNMGLRSYTFYWSMCKSSPNLSCGPWYRTMVQVFFIHLHCRSEVASNEGYGIKNGYHISRKRAWTWCRDGDRQKLGFLCFLWCKQEGVQQADSHPGEHDKVNRGLSSVS